MSWKPKTTTATTEEPAEAGRGWGENRDWHPLDRLLRKHGYRIHARPRSGPVLWRDRNGAVVTQDDALASVPQVEVRMAGGH